MASAPKNKSAKSSVSKKPSTRSLSAKKSVRKSTLKTSTKLGKKIDVSVKKINSKAGKSLKITDNTGKSTANSRKRSQKGKLSDLPKISPKQKAPIAVRKSFSPSVPSPYRFPMIRKIDMENTARFAGLFFVAVGGFFTLLNIQHIDIDSEYLTALTVSSLQAQTSGTAIYDNGGVYYPQSTPTPTTDVKTTTVNSLSDTTIKTPDAVITVGTGNQLTENVPIYVQVPFARKIDVITEDRASGNLLTLGSATKLDDTSWKLMWDTRKSPNGEYKVRVIVYNEFTSYEQKSAVTYAVSNQTARTQSSTDSATKSLTTDTVVPTKIEHPPIKFEISKSSPLSGRVQLKVNTPKATGVKFYASNDSTSGLTSYVGAAIKKSDTEWILDWDSRLLPDGVYNFNTRVHVDGMQFDGSQISRAVKNISVTKPENISTTTANSFTNEQKTTTSVVDLNPSILKPKVEVKLSKNNIVNGLVEVTALATDVENIELFAVQKSSLREQFVGRLLKISVDKWQYTLNTVDLPNGEYNIFARSKNSYGYSNSAPISIKVSNKPLTTLTPEQEEVVDVIHNVVKDLVSVVSGEDEVTPASTGQVYIQSPIEFIKSVYVDEDDATEERTEVEKLIQDYRKNLNKKMNEYARAIRNNDLNLATQIRDEIERLKTDILSELPPKGVKQEFIATIDSYLSQTTFELQNLTEKNEKILLERIGDAISKDSDGDGLTDYDEVNVYGTNPFAADTDGDGYIDSAEIALGYNPHDSTAESYVIYESAKESGIIREDVFTVDSLTNLSKSDAENDLLDDPRIKIEPKAKALISGKALPNSYVTLFIYSTPIIVTVKTDEKGNWNYIFDKELEDGNHEIYAGITDNAGKIIARSNPFVFTKTAEAFEETGAVLQAKPFTMLTPTLVSPNLLLLVASIAVVALGLILMLLGTHVSDRRTLLQPGLTT